MSEQNMESADEEENEDVERAPQPAEARHVPETGPTFAAAEPRILDLSKEIVSAVSRSPGERVTCRRISGNHYRCNWWAAHEMGAYDNPEMTGMMVTTHRVIRSQMLHVTKSGKALSIEPVLPQR
jgi:hypothetical protein